MRRYQLKTDEDFFYAIAAEKEVSILSADFIGGGTILLFNNQAILIGEQYYMRDNYEFYIEAQKIQ
ncbi:MAG: hypothetical protein ACE3L7_02270 [Candidatus Pristimantibacillus sp.]